MLGVFLHGSLPHFLRSGFSLNLELNNMARPQAQASSVSVLLPQLVF